MRVLKDYAWLGFFWAIFFGASIIIGGCAPTIKHSYDPKADFSTVKNYNWGRESSVRSQALVEKNVHYYADKYLKDKGFTLTSDKPDFVISMDYTPDYYDHYKVGFLTLYVHRTQGGGELIWQGTAEGTIKADASSDLAEGVKQILMNFPPKR